MSKKELEEDLLFEQVRIKNCSFFLKEGDELPNSDTAEVQLKCNPNDIVKILFNNDINNRPLDVSKHELKDASHVLLMNNINYETTLFDFPKQF